MRLWSRGRRDLRDDFIDDYVLGELRLSQRTADFYRDGLKALERELGKPPEQVTSDDLRAVKRLDGYAPGTLAGWIKAARAFHRWGAVEGHWALNGIAEVKAPRQDSKEIPPIHPGIARYVLENAAEPKVLRVASFCLLAGCRMFEACKMDRTDVRGDVLDFIGKRRKRRQVPIHPVLAERLDAILEHGPITRAQGQGAWERFRKQHDIRDVTGQRARSHGLRKCFGETTYDEGKHPWEVCQAILGHSLGVTEKYIHVTLRQKREVIDDLDYGRYVAEPTQLELAL